MSVSRRVVSRRTVAAVAAAAVLGVGGGVAASSASASSGGAVSSDVSAAPGDVWKRTELYFGTGKPDGTEVTDTEFGIFSDKELTRAFPNGFTELPGKGQWKGANGQIVHERSHVIVIVYSFADAAKANTEIEQIRADYKKEFQQEAVMRADSVQKVSF
ncbi:DUF3574 domain-containing protein [Amycolatopsis sp. NPDC059021]|uniref:DUF3574 domain-containing protein n=1 Tax=Amycolatopsis sp. NPDC059021 TaxID=3346704 RepID=UPI00366A70ED